VILHRGACMGIDDFDVFKHQWHADGPKGAGREGVDGHPSIKLQRTLFLLRFFTLVKHVFMIHTT
jgi:hypothetical protein